MNDVQIFSFENKQVRAIKVEGEPGSLEKM